MQLRDTMSRSLFFRSSGKEGDEVTKFDEALEYAIQVIGNWSYKNYIRKIYLYGSCARGVAGPDSDVDIYIQLETELPAEELRWLKTRCNSDDWKLPEVDIKIESTGLDSGDLFHNNIKNEGILLWEKK